MVQIIQYVLSCLLVGVGFACGHFALKLLAKRWSPARTPYPQAPAPTTAEVQAGETQGVLSRLHNLATGMAGDVHEHTANIEARSKELAGLSAGGDASHEAAVLQVAAGIMEANRRLQSQLDERTQVIEEQAREIECHLNDAMTDPLTGIPNRRAFDEELNKRIAEWKRRGTPISLLLFDIDHFKQFNDRYGHQTGDAVLRDVAGVITGALREMDLPARYGGEEFAAILPSSKIDDAKRAAERVRTAVETSALATHGVDFRVTVSVGLAEVLPNDDAATLVERADAAMYASKKSGRNCTFFHNGKTCEPVDPARHEISEVTIEQTSAGETMLASTGTVASDTLGAHPDESRKPESHDSRTDLLTGLPSREALREEVKRRVAEWQRHRAALSLVVVGIDELDLFNRNYGTAASDLVLETVPKFLVAAMRETDMVARIGEDEFALLLPYCPLSGAVALAERIRRAVGACDKLSFAGTVLRFTISLGIVETGAEDSPDSLIERAETALRASRMAGGNGTFLHDGKACEAVDSESHVGGPAD